MFMECKVGYYAPVNWLQTNSGQRRKWLRDPLFSLIYNFLCAINTSSCCPFTIPTFFGWRAFIRSAAALASIELTSGFDYW